MNADHVFAPKCDVSCFNCGALVELRPMPVAALADAVRGFLLMHRRCEKPAEPSKQVPLFDLPPVLSGRASDMLRELRLDDNDGIDANTDEPAPEIDPPALPPGWTESNGAYFKGENLGSFPCDEPEEHDKPELTEGDLPDYYAKFAELYPMASDPVKLTEQARRALGNTDYSAHLFDAMAKWHPSSVAFQLVAAWARIECAHLDSEARGISNPIAGLTIPAVLPMPAQLQEALRAMSGGKAPKKKRVRRAPTEHAPGEVQKP